MGCKRTLRLVTCQIRARVRKVKVVVLGWISADRWVVHVGREIGVYGYAAETERVGGHRQGGKLNYLSSKHNIVILSRHSIGSSRLLLVRNSTAPTIRSC